MTSDVVLTSALRNNLNSLKNTQSLIDVTQQHLSTGKKVNSALDNASSFFASQSLSNRASDLGKLLDGIGQSIEVIKAADNGVTALTDLVNQAQAIAQTAQTAATTGTQTASGTGTTSLAGTTLLKNLTGITAAGSDKVAITVIDPATGAKVLDGTVATGSAKGGLITLGANWTVNDLVNSINDLNSVAGTGGGTALATPAISASLDSSGHLQISAVNGGTLNVKFAASTSNLANDAGVASALGFSTVAKKDTATDGTTGSIEFTSSATPALVSKGLYTAVNTPALASTAIAGLKAADGTTVRTSTLVAGDSLTLSVNGKTSANVFGAAANTVSIQGVIDNINTDATIGSLVTASYNSTTGQISLTAKDPSATDIQFQLKTNNATAKTFDLFGTSGLTTDTTSTHVATEDVRFGAAAGQLASLQTQYNGIRSQIDSLVSNGDTAYQGTNLLNGNNLVTTFNESRTSTLTTQGQTFTSSGLGITTANFSNGASVTSSLTQITSALSTIRNFGSGLANDLSVIQSRQTFTNSTISTLQEGSDALVNADQNTESATLLALQTRQSLGVSALSLASQSAQSVLRLFQ